ncbi:hypothetical protein DERP_001926 [Dermatophagoides pteronyssinus]|uniref:Uncharacterized protein n=1 Tax=Dermatophagoides pteronyssinus TaxID=6956 RepID=A0ABQ8JBY6_DERPT|nr:hypothetical protein DERP_001926 [Dermatophagoides pteronyssinus]
MIISSMNDSFFTQTLSELKYRFYSDSLYNRYFGISNEKKKILNSLTTQNFFSPSLDFHHQKRSFIQQKKTTVYVFDPEKTQQQQHRGLVSSFEKKLQIPDLYS